LKAIVYFNPYRPGLKHRLTVKLKFWSISESNTKLQNLMEMLNEIQSMGSQHMKNTLEDNNQVDLAVEF
ncbi:unnamed protein product, partial [Oppiella nova]